FGVDERERHRGIGKKLFEGVKEYAKEMGCNAVQLGVNAENENARGFYEKIGLLPRTIIMAQNI
ncbi:MAG: GNAT family N-acetyltransferase, partial [Ruminiclostridium sp.]|nr:GNAT family N-acetyltransferase [Ruminiclostridium sp.]